MWKSYLSTFLRNKKIGILGFGREGQSTYRLLRSLLPDARIIIFDKSVIPNNPLNIEQDSYCTIYTGPGYLQNINNCAVVVKSPGIPMKELKVIAFDGILTSQSDLFMKCFAGQIIAITGTKGKSTTSSLLSHTLKQAGKKVIFVGNIGIPPFDEIAKIQPDTLIVYEISSHQLECISASPHIAVLLNIFQEHLDHYDSYTDYQNAKFKIGQYQDKKDFFIYNADNDIIAKHISKEIPHGILLPFSEKTAFEKGCYIDKDSIHINYNGQSYIVSSTFERQLKGRHNLVNMAVVMLICKLLDINEADMFKAFACFKVLPHRLEWAGTYNGKIFYNDSIATIPEATIEAIKTFAEVDTLIAGGFDRNIDYDNFARFLSTSCVRNIVFTGDAGLRIYKLMENLNSGKKIYYNRHFDEAVKHAVLLTAENKICLLSPAAASYGTFNNFEERGKRFCDIISGTV
ncbi:MAG: UDP-N-acetylmuramoylalanine--D-glutamate ligase [Bacteroidetes bacterium ADurb.Bin408]|nr:MAG: UDP-N-acetylmuramoylalanine--D-glutamate ligase [Bacteroidetes bacterium ADurb.Bin408]